MTWTVPKVVGEEEGRKWLSRYMTHLRGLVEHGRGVKGRGATPSDFGLVKLSQEEVDGLVEGAWSRGLEVESVYPLTGLQAGLLFETLRAGGGGAARTTFR